MFFFSFPGNVRELSLTLTCSAALLKFEGGWGGQKPDSHRVVSEGRANTRLRLLVTLSFVTSQRDHLQRCMSGFLMSRWDKQPDQSGHFLGFI